MSHIRVPKKQEFMKSFTRFEPTVLDHSAMIVAERCFREYFYRVVLGRVPRESFQYFGFGTCYHKFRELLELEYMKNPTKDEAKLQEMFNIALNGTLELWTKKKITDPVVGSRWDFLTRARLIESCIKAYKHWVNEKQKGNIIVIAVEQNFIVPMADGEYTGGKADQIVMWNGKPWGRDFKTTSKEKHYYERNTDPNDQMSRYTFGLEKLSGQPVNGVIMEVLYNAKSTKSSQKGPEIWTFLASRSTDQIKQWEKDQVTMNKVLELLREEDSWPMSETNCSFCKYHSVCTKATERAQMAKLEAEFNIEPWNFMERVDDEL